MKSPVGRVPIFWLSLFLALVLAGAGCGVFPSLEAGVKQMVKLGKTFEPDPRKQALYTERFAKYQRLWPLLAGYLRDLAE